MELIKMYLMPGDKDPAGGIGDDSNPNTPPPKDPPPPPQEPK